MVAENETNKKQIINVQTKSKLCSKRKHDSGIGGSALPILIWLAISAMKKNGQKHSFSELASAGLEVEYLLTDPDSSSCRAAMRLCVRRN